MSIKFSDQEPDDKSLQGLGGWLVLIGIATVLTPVGMVLREQSVYRKVFFEGNFSSIMARLATEHPFIPTLITLELICNICFFIAWLYLGFLFFSKRKLFPRFFIWVVILTPVAVLLDSVAIAFTTNVSMFDTETVLGLLKNSIYALITVPYMLGSKRVQATFIS